MRSTTRLLSLWYWLTRRAVAEFGYTRWEMCQFMALKNRRRR
jgi:hypothetical protein